ncbi:hypothetical protein PIB30_090493 [Stylosanthes scabra]|uniref:GH18 domain-containing protein n=1 Tax=Stylosanthes scabra TaxID=79078 RepID=A0ABU6UW13_9FABA|nr:hypothetical protein [Stylosanthes scabra]
MATTRKLPHSSSFLFLAIALSSCLLISFSRMVDCACPDVAVYWGQHSDSDEGILTEVCDSKLYKFVILKELIVSDDASFTLNLANHCGTPENPCSVLEDAIKHCQEDLGIKVFISIGLDTASSEPPSEDVTLTLAKNLIDNFFSNNPFGPLGSVTLDGLDIEEIPDSKHIHWPDLVSLLSNKTIIDTKVPISISPQCVYPDTLLEPVLKTGYVDYLWVEFFENNPTCIYTKEKPQVFFNAWKTWTSSYPSITVFLGLTANKDIPGYIDPDTVKNDILPKISTSSNYGGVAIFDRYEDVKNNYTPRLCDDDDDDGSKRSFIRTVLIARS